jgi:hypothetical protein
MILISKFKVRNLESFHCCTPHHVVIIDYSSPRNFLDLIIYLIILGQYWEQAFSEGNRSTLLSAAATNSLQKYVLPS